MTVGMSDIQMMLNSLVNKVKGIILTPVEAFQQARADDPKTLLMYFAPLLVFYAILATIVSMVLTVILSIFNPLGIAGGIVASILGFFIILIAYPIIAAIFTVWLHIITYIAGGRKDIFQTGKAVFYGMTPTLLLGWIPIVAYVAGIVSIIYATIGLRELQELDTVRAIIVMAIAVLVPLVIVIILAVLFFAAIFAGNLL